MRSILNFVHKWKHWYRVLHYRKGFGRLSSVRYGLWLTRGCSLVGLIIALVVAMSAQDRSEHFGLGQWRIAGQNLSNTWNQPSERSISPANVSGLTPKWVFTTGGDVSATPTVDGDAVYFPDWGGNLFAVDKESGRLIWSHKISDYDAAAGAFSRVSPAVDGEQLIIGDTISETELHNGANVMAVDKRTGALRWITQVEGNRAATYIRDCDIDAMRILTTATASWDCRSATTVPFAAPANFRS